MMINENSNNSILVSDLLAAHPVFSCQLDGKGKANPLNDKSEASISQPYWIHLDFAKSETINWINQTNLIPDLVKNELIKPNQFPKEIRFDTGILVVLKGVNFTPNELPDPIVTFRFYITDNFIISTRHQKIDAIIKLKENLEKGIGPVDVADWLIQLSELICDQVNLSFDGVHNKIIKLEDLLLNQRIFSHKEIGRVRKQLFILRRLLSPQRDIFVKISTERISWIDDNDRQRLHDISSQQNHYVSEIDSCLIRIGSVMEQINSILAESTNKRIYLMSLFTIIFTPITFITSLLGVNLAGIPFNEKEWSFIGLILLLILISILSVVWLKLKKWW
ncbi:zinc transporter ZntB [Gilliamella sp. B2865]|uniref:zinc transporter ZntB n=2 Tax=unclassified Gilliamella TaxID=2685620 RepID=UPI0008104232|nr:MULTISPECIES: zinc transporter ZntB [Gilliamella]MCX8675422.1 zinc transporter ZntB [Gilliamella sp. B3023]MCX8678536.1 zinc transporter ZntB [Gilliamella sp. B2865]MCX8685155.1 zinc transporter ZntB [Gilliamella sp. B2864]